MRVGIFDPYLDDIGGGEKYMMTIASVLSQKYTVDVFWDNTSDLELVSNRFHIDTSKCHVVPNVFKSTVPLFKKVLLTRKYDVIIFLSDGSIPLVGSKKLFVHIQQPLEYLQQVSFFAKLKVKRVSKFFCNSAYTRSFIDKKFHIPTEIIYPPVALRPQKVKKENIIMHVGRFRVKNVSNGDYKKQSLMIDAFKHMVDTGLKNWKFILAVSFSEKENSEFEKMQQQAKGYPVEFLINQTNAKLWDTYSKAKIYWHASGYGEDLVHHPEFAEHFGISTVEAMGAGVVPVVINAGGQKEIVTEGISGYLWDTLDQLQSKTKRLTQDDSLREKLSGNAKEKAQQFSEKAFEEKIHSLIEQ